MSGVTEWKNAVFLWVNVDGGSGYENLFERDASSSQGAGTADDSKAGGADPDPAAAATTTAATHQTSKASTGAEWAPAEGDWRVPRNPRKGAPAAAPAPTEEPIASSGNGSNEDDDAKSGERAGEAAETTTTVVVAADDDAAAAGRLAGLRMTWFAGSRMTAESSLIQRLLVPGNPPKAEAVEAKNDSPSAGGAARSASDDDQEDGGDGGGSNGNGGGGGGYDDDDAVLLFCRLPNEPYVFCGRLGYSKHSAGERPIRFVWRLLDADRLAGLPDFEAVVEVAGVE